MYKVFNMGHRMEIYCDQKDAQHMVDVAKSFSVEAQIVGKVESSTIKNLQLRANTVRLHIRKFVQIRYS